MTYGVSTESEDELWFASTCADANFLCSNFSNSLRESCHCARQTAEISGETSLRVSLLLGVKKSLLLFTSPHKKTVVGFWRPELCGASKNRPIQNSFRLKFPSNSMFFFLLPRIVWVQVFSSEACLVCLNVAHNATVVAGRYGTMPYMSPEMAASAGHSFSTFELLLENENEKH